MRINKLIKFINLCVKFLILSKRVKVIFFFPCYHTGGAEKVHLGIVKSIQKNKSIVLFTYKSYNKHYLEEFKNHTYCFDISPFLASKIYKSFFTNIIKISNRLFNNAVFGCNSTFFYDILPKLRTHTKKIDLIHAFSFPDKNGIEFYSLNCANVLDYRITINNKTKDDFMELYKNNNVNTHLLNNVKIISNYVEIPEFIPRLYHANLNINYIGRIAKEKRVNLFVDIANHLVNHNFSIYGHEEIKVKGIEKYYKGNLINDDMLNEVYNTSHILLITSYREGFPMVIMEAMAHGVVCISTDVGGISEHIINAKNGFLIPNYENEDQIVTAFVSLIDYLTENPSIMQQCAIEAYNYAKMNFSKDLFMNKYNKILSN